MKDLGAVESSLGKSSSMYKDSMNGWGWGVNWEKKESYVKL